MYRKIFLWVILCILVLTPFLWLKPGYIDIGGDSSRLYFYDPINYLKSFSLYSVSPNGFNTESNGSYLIPFTLFLALLKFFLSSPYIITTLINSLTLVSAFLSVFAIVTTFLNPYVQKNKDRKSVYFASVAAGIFYTFSPALLSLGWWTVALSTHNQFFLNPLMFFLLLTYIVRKNFIYLLVFLLLSFIFSPNFFLSPYFFSFYPIAIVFLFIYAIAIVHIRLNIKEIAIALCLYLLIHSVHLFRYIFDLFQTNSGTYQLVFSEVGKIDRGLGYFLSVQSGTKILNNLLGIEQGIVIGGIHLFWFPILGIILFGLSVSHKVVQDKKISKTLSLSLIFFLVTFYLITAKITNISLELYKFLFNVPGFGMFRNYVGQFSHVYIFFYSLVFGISIFYLFVYIRKLHLKVALLVAVIVVFIISAIPFIRGDAINIVLNTGSKEEIKTPIRMDLQYEQNVLVPIRENKYDGKYFLFPMDDSGAQVLRGEDGGYIGPPTIAYLTGKSVFSGLGGLGEFYQPFMSMVINKDYVGINNILSMLNVKYLFFNSDEKIYGDNFPGYPYSRARTIMPSNIDLYKIFFDLLAVENKKKLGGTYHLYELNKRYYRPHIYVAKENYSYDASISSFFPLIPLENENRIAVYDNNDKTFIPKNIEGIFIEAKKENEFMNFYKNKPDSIAISDSTTPEIYALLHPLLILPEKTPDKKDNNLLRSKSVRNIPYTVDFPAVGNYKIYMQKKFLPQNRTVSSVAINKAIFTSLNFKQNDYWASVGEYNIKAPRHEKFTFTIPDNVNYFQELLDFSSDKLSSVPHSINIVAKGKLLGVLEGIIGGNVDWDENTTYIISFEYKIKNPGYVWKKYKAIIETGNKIADARLVLLNNQNTDSEKIDSFYQASDLDIRNLAVVGYSYPKFLLKKQQDVEKKPLPIITFTKINPAKYEVHVRNANDPYTLVFLDAFNQNWNVFLKNKNSSEKKQIITKSHYGGFVNEGEHREAFFEASTLDSWFKEPIAESTHRKVNGYANAWQIKPSDVDGKTDYTLILEMTSQRTLYILLVLSFGAASLCLILLIIFLIKKKRSDMGHD